jgi:putative transcriptional regulator
MKWIADNVLPLCKGRLLVAELFLADYDFGRTVVLLAEHGKKGTVGFILNKPLEMRVDQVVPDFPYFPESIYYGGPVQRDQLFYIHTLGEQLEGSLQINDDTWWLGDFEQLKLAIKDGKASPDQVRLYAGYAGWEPGQLKRELDNKSWFVAKASLDLIFHNGLDRHWNKTVQSMGEKFAYMANFPENPLLN